MLLRTKLIFYVLTHKSFYPSDFVFSIIREKDENHLIKSDPINYFCFSFPRTEEKWQFSIFF